MSEFIVMHAKSQSYKFRNPELESVVRTHGKQEVADVVVIAEFQYDTANDDGIEDFTT